MPLGSVRLRHASLNLDLPLFLLYQNKRQLFFGLNSVAVAIFGILVQFLSAAFNFDVLNDIFVDQFGNGSFQFPSRLFVIL